MVIKEPASAPVEIFKLHIALCVNSSDLGPHFWKVGSEPERYSLIINDKLENIIKSKLSCSTSTIYSNYAFIIVLVTGQLVWKHTEGA